MIEALKSEEVVNMAGGRFKLCALIQHRLRELVDGARPLVERGQRSDLEIVIEEILQEKIAIGALGQQTPGLLTVLPSED